jgi:tRNA pseudouridine32 synthase / 23S rRNA pseudouridine746 synthase
VSKRYVAVVEGLVTAPVDTDGWGSIDLPIAADWPNRPLRTVDVERGQPSLTRWRVVVHDTVAGTTRLELAPVTGRTHQLRVHLQAIGHPILGDAWYAPAEVAGAAPRLLLHACGLELRHPASGGPLAFSSAPPF